MSWTRRIWYDSELVRERVWKGTPRGVVSDGRLYYCYECGHVWPALQRYVWWPIRVHVTALRNWLSVASWGVEIGADRCEQLVFARVVRLGPITIVFGRTPQLRNQ